MSIGDDRFPAKEDVVAELPAAPRYCPRCDQAAEPLLTLCATCGERLVEQGHCLICERSWRLPVGAACPKHETALGERPPEREAVAVAASRWVTVGRFVDAMKAEAPRIRLEAEGIPTFVEGARMGSQSMYHVATGGVKLQVPSSLFHEARVLLAQSWSAPESDEDDAWDELAPEPGAVRRSIMKGVILVILFGPFVLALFAWLLGV